MPDKETTLPKLGTGGNLGNARVKTISNVYFCGLCIFPKLCKFFFLQDIFTKTLSICEYDTYYQT